MLMAVGRGNGQRSLRDLPQSRRLCGTWNSRKRQRGYPKANRSDSMGEVMRKNSALKVAR